MPTRLTRYADGLIEAAWLAALLLVPVFFNIYSTRIFEPDKIALLRSLALLGLGAWLVRIAEAGRAEWGAPEDETGGRLARVRALLRVPLAPAVLALALAYLLATALSVTPRASFFGSYQRLQGTYTTFSYLVLFLLAAVHLRRREQLDRLVTVVILAGLPVGLYGILQKFEIDPIPWGGDTSFRVAANMGNAIFAAAYLIMALPLAFGRIAEAFTRILDEREQDLFPHVVRGTVYVFTAAIMGIALYFTLSRGPILGLLAGTFFMLLLLSLYWGRRRLTLGVVGAAAALGVFLVVFALPGGPLAGLRSNENIGRLGNVFQTDSGTGRVRVLIWEGVARMVWFHEPLVYPDGSTDPFNTLRPFIGYGPEAMYVAYSPFYPPELANLEARNATPDRSHNETWDALVITGMLGLAAEQFVFLSVFYYGLKWLGLLSGRRWRALFLGLVLGGGALSGVGFALLADPGFLGVGLPFGMLLGLLAYIALAAVFGRYAPPQSEGARARDLLLTALLAAVIAHYVEIHFGIAIAATRAHFWIYAGAMLAAGWRMTLQGAFGAEARARLLGEPAPQEAPGEASEEPKKPARAARPLRRARGRRRAAAPGWRTHAWAWGLLSGLLLATLSFDYLTNSTRSTSFSEILRRSLAALPTGAQETASYGILAIFLTCWLAAALLAASEWARGSPGDWRAVFLHVGWVSLAAWGLYTVLHAGGLIRVIEAAAAQPGDTGGLDAVLRQAGRLEGLLTLYYLLVLGLLLGLAAALAREAAPAGRLPDPTARGAGAALLGLALVLVLAWTSNMRVIHANMAFKVGEPFARGDAAENWGAAVELFQRANAYAPYEDHYYLFLGRAYLELTRRVQNADPARAQALMRQAEGDLLRAQRINPLNTDHTANLGRLYRFWAGVPGGAEPPDELRRRAEAYYERALALSPNNAAIWNEWATLRIQDLGDTQGGLALLETSLAIDPDFHSTHGLLGDTYGALARLAETEAEREAYAALAVTHYTEAHRLAGRDENRYLYAAALGAVHGLLEDYAAAAQAYRLALEAAAPGQAWLVEDTLAKTYTQAGDYAAALDWARLSLQHAPAEQQAVQQQLIDTILALQNQP